MSAYCDGYSVSCLSRLVDILRRSKAHTVVLLESDTDTKRCRCW